MQLFCLQWSNVGCFTTKNILVTPDIFRGAWVGWTKNVTLCVINWVWTSPLIWFIEWTHKIWGLLEGLIKQGLKVRTNAKTDNVRKLCTSTWKELCYFTISIHLSKQGHFAATRIQRIVIQWSIDYPVNPTICYHLICWKFLYDVWLDDC